jgi:hypothetical protein
MTQFAANPDPGVQGNNKLIPRHRPNFTILAGTS